MIVGYCAEFGLRPLLSEEDSYSISELQPLGLGSYYLRLAAERSKIPNAWGHHRVWGDFPKLGLTRMGSVNSSSFSERHNSAGKAICTDKRRSLSNEEIEMVATLRINKPFIKFMKANHLAAALAFAGLKKPPTALHAEQTAALCYFQTMADIKFDDEEDGASIFAV